MSNQVNIKLPKVYQELFNPSWRYILYYGGRGALKSHSVARALLLRGRQEKLRILCTREKQNSIADSVHKLLKDLIVEYEFNDYEVLDKTIKNTVTGTEFIFKGLHRNLVEIKSTEGVDIAWCEESHSLSHESLDILLPTIRKANSQLIFTFNRHTELDPVYTRFILNPPPKTYAKMVNYTDILYTGFLPQVILDEAEHDRQNYPQVYAHKWLGEPIGQEDNAIISRGLVLEAMQRNVEASGAIEVGVDVARMGDDRSVFWGRKGLVTTGYKIYSKTSLVELAAHLETFINNDKTILLKIDDSGVGGGLVDIMTARSYNVSPVNFGAKAHDPDKYPNWISEAWFYLLSIIETVQLPYDSDVLNEMTTRLYTVDTSGKRVIESKQHYKGRGYRSPDLCDALILAYSHSPEQKQPNIRWL